MKTLKTLIFLLVFLALGLGAGMTAGPYLKAWFEPSREVSGDFRAYLKPSGQSLVMFSTSTCPYCKSAREYLASHNLPYEEYVIDKSPEAMETYRQLDEKGVPVFLTATRKLRGFNPARLDQAIKDASSNPQ